MTARRSHILLVLAAFLAGLVIFLGVFLYATGQFGAGRGGSASLIGGPFQLVDQDGKPATEQDMKGKPFLMFFGFTHCPDVCPTALFEVSEMMRALGPDADRTGAFFVTVDPERDTPELLAQYVPAFHPSFLGLYGDAQATAQAAKAFYVGYDKRPTASGYNMDHSVGTFLVDPSGKVRLRAPHAQSADRFAGDIRLLLGGA